MVMIYGQGTFDNYRAALAAVGLETEVSTDTAVARRCEGLLLPGGGDIFGGLDRRETAVINAFVARRRPVLGICRGMQALNVYFGGTLFRCCGLAPKELALTLALAATVIPVDFIRKVLYKKAVKSRDRILGKRLTKGKKYGIIKKNLGEERI